MAVNDRKMPTAKKTSCLSNRMGSRTVEISAVGAWVQPEINTGNCNENVVRNAHLEEERVRREREEKKDRLLAFQQSVKHRMHQFGVAKRLQQQQSCTPVEIVGRPQSLIKENVTRKLADNNFIIAQRHVNTEDFTNLKKFEEHKDQVLRHNRHARKNLMSWKIADGNTLGDDLPGGIWKNDHTSTRSTVHIHDPGYDLAHSLDSADKENKDVKIVHFEPEFEREETRDERISRKSAPVMTGTQLQRVTSVLRPDAAGEQEKLAAGQRALYRRMYMHLEREQVKENQRRLQHRHNINKLKREKEEERNRVELLASQQATSASDDTSGLQDNTKDEEEEERQKMEARQLRAQKNKETQRFVEALRNQLKEKVDKQNIELPPLCCCGPTLWHTDPRTCANNCVFYRNPKAYTKALQSMLASCEVI